MDRTERTPACCSSFTCVPHRRIAGRAGYWLWLLVVLVVAVAQRRLAPSSSATTSTVDRALVLVAAYGGLRIGELAGLRRRRVDLLRGALDVAEIVVEVRGELYMGPL
jgi:hypothetical protein